MNIKELNAHYEKQHIELWYQQAFELAQRITNEQYAELVDLYPDLFKIDYTEDVLQNPELLQRLISVYTEVLNRGLTKEDLCKMTNDEIEAYVLSLIRIPTQSYSNILDAIKELLK